MPFELPAPSMIFDVALDDGAKIRMRRLGFTDGVRLLFSHGNGFAADAYFPYWQHLLANFDLVIFDFPITGKTCRSCHHIMITSSSRPIWNKSYRQ